MPAIFRAGKTGYPSPEMNLGILKNLSATAIEYQQRIKPAPVAKSGRADQNIAARLARRASHLRATLIHSYWRQSLKVASIPRYRAFRKQNHIRPGAGGRVNPFDNLLDVLVDGRPELHLHGRDLKFSCPHGRKFRRRMSRGVDSRPCHPNWTRGT